MVGRLHTPVETGARVMDAGRLVESIIRQLRSFPQGAIDSGRRALAGVGQDRWCSKRRLFTVPVASELVTLSLRGDAELERECTCGEPLGDCAHGYAALYHLYSELPTRDAPLTLDAAPPPAADSWRDGLSALDRVLRQRHDSARKEPDVRLAWKIAWGAPGPDGRARVEVIPCEQKRGRSDAWNRPKKLTWQRLLTSPELWTRPADRTISGLLRQAGVGGEIQLTRATAWGVDPLDLIEHLVGEPHVVTDESPPHRLDVTRAELGLVVRSDPEALRLVPSLDGREISDPSLAIVYRRGVLLYDAGERRLLVAVAPAAKIALVEYVLAQPVEFPLEARDELLSRVPALERLLPIRLPEELEAKSITADRRLRILVRPQGNSGLSIALRSRPLPDGAYLVPGEGESVLTAFVDGRGVRTRRKLDDETARSRDLADRLALPSLTRDTSWKADTESIDRALELLTRLQTISEREAIIEWPDGEEIRLFPEPIGPSALRVAIRDEGDLFGLDGFAQVEEERVLLALLLERVRVGSPFVPVGEGQWAQISDQLAEKLRRLADLGALSGYAQRCDRTMLPVVEEALEGVEVDACESWTHLASRYDAALERTPRQAKGLRATLRDYQSDGYGWMSRLARVGVGACLADDMGLGKTVQTLSILLERSMMGPTLVVAPTSVTTNWIDEAGRFAPSLHAILYRETDRRGEVRRFQRGDVVVVSYGLLRRDIDRLKSQRWGTVVLDEAQQIKNARSQTTRAILSLDSRWRLALTGTPIENHLGELWSLFQFLAPGLLGSWERFRRDYAEPIERSGDEEAARRLSTVVRPFVLRRTKEEVLHELPPKTEVRLTAHLSPAERRLYEDVRLSALARLAKKSASSAEDLRFDVLAAMTRLRQLACHPRLVYPELDAPSAKLATLLETLDTVRRGGHRALIFSQFTSHLRLIRDALEERSIAFQYLDGQTPAQKRAGEIRKFREGNAPVFLISLMAGGTGLNLTEADYVIHMDPWWNPAIEDQATDRAHRMGQERPVTVYRIVAANTIEEEVLRLQDSKRELVSSVLEGTDRAAKASPEEWLAMIRAGAAARERSSDDGAPEVEVK